MVLSIYYSLNLVMQLWKGGEHGKVVRENAAKEKLVDISNQSKILNCKKIIPFASFIYFSNKLNFYMNDSVNSPETVYDYLTKSLLNPIIMQPGEKQFVNQLRQNKSSLEFWKDKFEFNSQNKGIDIYKKSYKLEESKMNLLNIRKKYFLKIQKL